LSEELHFHTDKQNKDRDDESAENTARRRINTICAIKDEMKSIRSAVARIDEFSQGCVDEALRQIFLEERIAGKKTKKTAKITQARYQSLLSGEWARAARQD
jgi:hypothetical protein